MPEAVGKKLLRAIKKVQDHAFGRIQSVPTYLKGFLSCHIERTTGPFFFPRRQPELNRGLSGQWYPICCYTLWPLSQEALGVERNLANEVVVPGCTWAWLAAAIPGHGRAYRF